MPIIAWSKTTGSANLPHWGSVSGKKQVPFDRSYKPDLPYDLSQFILGNHVLGVYGGKVGTQFWGETNPSHIVSRTGLDGSFTFTSEGAIAYARAYSKFKDSAYSQASNLTALAERVKTIDMVLARLQQLYKGAKALRAGRFSEFTRTFGIRPLKKHENTRWTRPKQFGALWLEYWMGWAPTVGDVYSSIDALSRKIPDHTIRSGSSVPLSSTSTQTASGVKATTKHVGKGTVWIQAKVQVTNPALHIAQTLGLVNPVKTLWETTGFSWFYDWFTNVGQCLSRITDWVGLQLSNIVISVKTEYTTSWTCTDARNVFGYSAPKTMFHEKSRLWFSRGTAAALPLVKPIFRLPNGLSLSRGATLASLLATMFAPSRR